MKNNLFLFGALLLFAVIIGCAKDDVKSDLREQQHLTILDTKLDFSLNLQKSKAGDISHEADAIASLDDYFKTSIGIASTAVLTDSDLVYNGKSQFLVYMNYEIEEKYLSTLMIFRVNGDSDKSLMLVPVETHTCSGDPCNRCTLEKEEKDGETIVTGCECAYYKGSGDGHCNHSVTETLD